MRLPLYQVDAFTDELFGGNPAAICPLERWLPDATMQAIAAENNLSETAFFVRDGGGYALRWFTPTIEVDLCGHATLAAGFVVMGFLEPQRESVSFHTVKAGTLTVTRTVDMLAMDFPARPAAPTEAPAGLLEALGGTPRAVLRARDFLVVYDRAADIKAIEPDFPALAAVNGCWAAIATAPGENGVDFVSRFFAPAQGVPEDPATGSAHCNCRSAAARFAVRSRATG
jgi:PhzF family phenazine biosynthesis protein